MKTILLLIFCWLVTDGVSSAMAQTSSMDSEKSLNKKLEENADKSRQIEAAKPQAAPASIKILSNKGSSTSAPSKDNLTDQEKQLSENFVDQAGANRILRERCVGEMEAACRGETPDHKIMGMNPGMIRAATMAYTMIGTMGGDGLLELKRDKADPAKADAETIKKQDASNSNPPQNNTGDAAKPADGKEAKKEEEKAEDYCKYIPAATETFATFAQKNTTNSLSANGQTSQKEQLLKAARSHDSKAEQASIQSYGWYGGAVCYAGMAVAGKFNVNTSLIVKLGAATFLGTFYLEEKNANEEYARKTREIANALPGKGDCNPITQNQCYCSTPEYANDPIYCKNNKQNPLALKSPFMRVACTNDQLKIDPNCECTKSNTCLDKIYENLGAADIQLGFGSSNSPIKTVGALARGRLDNGLLNGQAAANAQAIAKKALQQFANKIPANTSPLSGKQKTNFDLLTSKGIPSNVARLMVDNAPSDAQSAQAMGKFAGMSGGDGSLVASYNGNYSGSSSRVLDFSGGGGLGVSGQSGKSGGNEDLLGKLVPNKGGANNAKLIEFAQRAQNQAQSSQIAKPDKPLFEIISLRYQISGRRLLQVEGTN